MSDPRKIVLHSLAGYRPELASLVADWNQPSPFCPGRFACRDYAESTRGQLGEQFVELSERLHRCFLCAGAGGVERFLRRVQLAHDEQRPAIVLFERDGGDGPRVAAFFVRPYHALDRAGIAWREVFVGKGAAVLGAAAVAGLAVAVLAPRAAPAGAVDVGGLLSLPAMRPQDVVLYSNLSDRRTRDALRVVTLAFQ